MSELKKIIIIPAYNEEESIIQTVEDIKEYAPGFDYVVINDCSKDKTESICRQNHYNCINLPINLGIGGAVQTGYKFAARNGYDIAVQVDGDGQHDVSYLPAMLKMLEESRADIIIGSRFIENTGFQSSAARRIGISFLRFIIYLGTGTSITDPTSGMRMINKDLIKLFSKNYPQDYPEPESLVVLSRRGYVVKEIPVKMRDRQGGISSISIRKSVYYMVKVSLAILIQCLDKRNKRSKEG